jgi:hypothetical protein
VGSKKTGAVGKAETKPSAPEKRKLLRPFCVKTEREKNGEKASLGKKRKIPIHSSLFCFSVTAILAQTFSSSISSLCTGCPRLSLSAI